MAIFSSESAALSIIAPVAPTVVNDPPVVSISGANCEIMTVTLKSTTTRTKTVGVEEVRVLTKIFTIDCTKPTEIKIEVKQKIDSDPEKLEFVVTIDPHARAGTLRPHPYPGASGTFRNPAFFIGKSAKPQLERSTLAEPWYETYKLALVPQPDGRLYVPVPVAPDVEKQIFSVSGSNFYLPEYRSGQWGVLTIASLLNDLLPNMSPLELG